ncbi:diphthine--ammonia ligase [soil metagenome]
MEKEKVSISWSGGKDCSYALYKILFSETYEVVSLHTTIDAQTKKVGLHGIPENLVVRQSEILGIPLEKIYLNVIGSTSSYEEIMIQYYKSLRAKGIDKIVSGDIFLEDLRKYKEDLAASAGLDIIFPLWGSDTKELIKDFIHKGFKAKICAINSKHFSQDHLGKSLDLMFIKNLSASVDPCGEYGEYHTFTYGGPIFSKAIPFLPGSIYFEDYNFKTSNNKQIKSQYYYMNFL